MSRLSRQSFLGPNSEVILSSATIGIVGLGGGGSHEAQQLAHIGIGGYVNADPDHIDHSNTNRLVGGTLSDVLHKTPKVDIAERIIRGLQPNARIISVQDSWQDAADDLKLCDVILGAMDSFKEREQLERFARRHLIPYVDIGMIVTNTGKEGYLISGQVVLSTPGNPCLRCCGIITDERLKREAENYGDAGELPQVVWANGILASTAVGLAIKILTPWYRNPPAFAYLEYDGNDGVVRHAEHMKHRRIGCCPHHPENETGDALFDIREFLERKTANASSSFGYWWHEFMLRCHRFFRH